MLTLHHLATAGVMGVLCANAQAGLLYYEGFSGAAGAGSAGWTTEVTGSATGDWLLKDTGTSSGSLEYTKGGKLQVSGLSGNTDTFNRLDTGHLYCRYDFSTPMATSGTTWVSGLVMQTYDAYWSVATIQLLRDRLGDGNDAAHTNASNEVTAWAGIEDEDTPNSDYGYRYQQWQTYSTGRNGTLGSTGVPLSTSVAQATLFVIKLDADAQTMQFWINPTIGDASPSAADFDSGVLPLGANDPSVAFDAIRLDRFNSPANKAYVDEIRIGTTFADVTPVPEPTVPSIVAAGALATLSRRRR